MVCLRKKEDSWKERGEKDIRVRWKESGREEWMGEGGGKEGVRRGEREEEGG